MEVHASQWHVKLYLWSRQIWNTFRDDNDWSVHHNLCLYLRSIFVWAPFVIISHISLFVWAGYVLVYYPVTRLGWTGFAWEIGVVSAIVGVIFLYVKIRHYMRDRSNEQYVQRRMAALNERDTQYGVTVSGESKITKGPSFIDLIFDYLDAVKQKTCPTIKIISDKEGL